MLGKAGYTLSAFWGAVAEKGRRKFFNVLHFRWHGTVSVGDDFC